MTRAMKMSAFVAMGILMAASTAAAQNAPTTTGGQVTIGARGMEDVLSSKFTEYRELPTGVSIPYVNLFATNKTFDFNLTGYNVQQSDQRFLGSLKALGMGLKFDYNQTPHNMGNDGRSIFNESAPGVWTMSASQRQALQTAVTSVASAARTYDFYSALLAPTFESANRVDLSGVRKTGNFALSLGKRLPFDVTLSYRNELKEGYRGVSGGNIRGIVNPSYEVAAPLDEVTHDFGVRAAKSFKSGNLYASINRNLYNNRAETIMLDNPFQAFDAPIASGVGGPSRDRFVMAPDNEATTSSAGFLLKLRKQTRISGSFTLSSRTQDAPFYPYTASAAINTPAGLNAGSSAALAQQSYGGEVNTTSYNLSFSSKPFDGFIVRAAYRVYDLTDNSNKWIIKGDMSAPQSNWNTVTATADSPFGHATANIYDTKTARYSASATYDYKALTLEGQIRGGQLERTHREAEKGTESGMGLTAMYHVSDWLGVRGTYDLNKRTADGHTLYGFQMDEAAFENTRTGVDIEVTPTEGLDLSVAYFRRDVQYVDRPNRIAIVSGAPAAGAVAIPNSPSGLLETTYDSYTGELNYAPNARLSFGGYYTYEKNLATNQWSTTNSATATVNKLGLNNLLNHVATDATSTFGANLSFQLVPEKATVLFNATHQKVDGLLDITANETGTFYTPGRTGLIPAGQGGAADIDEWDDTELTTLSAQIDCTMAKNLTFSTGYMFEKFDYKDAMNSSTKLMPAHVYIFMKPNAGAYDANIVFAKLTFKF